MLSLNQQLFSSLQRFMNLLNLAQVSGLQQKTKENKFHLAAKF